MNERILHLADVLFQHGVRALFGVAGSGLSWQLITAMEQRGIPYWGVAHEAAGAIMAGAYGRQTGSLGCAISIKGPGLANMFPGIVSNHYEQMATLSISEAYGPSSSRARMHKRLDHRGVLAGVVKAYVDLGDPAWTIARLAETAKSEIPGPVHLDLTPEEGARSELFGHESGESADPAPVWDRLQRLIERSAKPAVLVGSLTTRSEWGPRLATLSVPIFATVAAKGVVDETRPYAAGIFTGDGKRLAPESVILKEADCIVGLGLRNLEILTPRPFSVPLVLLDAAADPRLTLGFNATETLLSAKSLHFETVLELLRGKGWGEELVAKSQASLRSALGAASWLPARLFAALETALPGARCLVLDTGLFCTVAEHLWRVSKPAEFLASANGRYMGTGLPMALGAALADRSRPTVCVVGDGGVRPYLAEFNLAIEEKLPLLLVLMSDGRYGSLAAAPSAAGLTSRAITLPRPSWRAAIGAMGCEAASVKTVDELTNCLRGWRREGPLFLETRFDPDAYAAMTADLR